MRHAAGAEAPKQGEMEDAGSEPPSWFLTLPAGWMLSFPWVPRSLLTLILTLSLPFYLNMIREASVPCYQRAMAEMVASAPFTGRKQIQKLNLLKVLPSGLTGIGVYIPLAPACAKCVGSHCRSLAVDGCWAVGSD